MDTYTQDRRFISIKTPLGEDELLLTAFKGEEHLSKLFEFQIETLSSNHKITPDKLIGKAVTITIKTAQMRKFHGYVSDFIYGEIKGALRIYRMKIVPWFWFLSKNSDHRIFQKKSSKEIISSIFKDAGFNDFDYRATGNPKPREYCVQYNETDLAFISRLLEEDGIAYYFQHEEDKHTLVIVDQINAYQTCAETDLSYSRGSHTETAITKWNHLYEFGKGNWSLDDYNFKKPGQDQFQSTSSLSKFPNVGEYEHYEYQPYHDFSGIKELSKKRIEAEEVSMNTVEAHSDCSSFYAGGKFKLSGTQTEEHGAYIITSIWHTAHDNSYQAHNESDVNHDYSNKFSCIPENVQYRPALRHAKPIMPGSQSALVVGPAGKEIYVDDVGRIKVQFHWDRQGQKNEKSTCWIRVMQPWSGAGWGASFIPRIGMEVVVSFLDADADRPIILGCVYNGENAPPFESKTQSGIRTRSSKQGNKNNANEFRFDDAKGGEQIFVHAEKNMDTEIENNETLTVDNDRNKTVHNNETVTIDNDRTETVHNNETITVDNNRTESVGKNETISIGANRRETVGANESVAIGANQSVTVGSKQSVSVASNQTLTVGGARAESIALAKALSIGAAYQISVGGAKNETVGGSSTEQVGVLKHIIAGKRFELVVGDSSLILNSDGTIILSAKEIKIEGSKHIEINSKLVDIN